jgi:hypothetical protein
VEGEYTSQSFLAEGSPDDYDSYAYPQVACDDDGWDYCVHCEGYFDDDSTCANDTDTEDDSESQAYMSHGELEDYLGSEPLPGSIDEAKGQYLLAKRRFRHMAGKSPRHFRQPRRFKGGGKGAQQEQEQGQGQGRQQVRRLAAARLQRAFAIEWPLPCRGGRGRRQPEGRLHRRRRQEHALPRLQQ